MTRGPAPHALRLAARETFVRGGGPEGEDEILAIRKQQAAAK